MKNLRRCKNNWIPENVVLIDVDRDTFNYVNIDIPENLANKLQGSNRLTNGKNVPPTTYIYIDDDDDVDEIPNNQPVKLSKSKRMYAGRGSNNSCDDDDSSDKGDFDGEFMVDSSGVLQDQWERAYLKRKTNVQSDQCPNDTNLNTVGKTNDLDKNAKIDAQEESLMEDHSSSNQNPFSVETVDCSQEFGHRDDKSKETPSSSITISSKVENEGSFIKTDDAPVENSIVNEREKLKETDEYKRAIEEEWSARQMALKVQAEEAQQLRRYLKRKKAEKLRLLDMERRQKQRLEEIRETQKKAKENMNLKEKYRTEVQQELNKLKTTCHDMASLLRALGILTNNDPSASSLQVRVAYKRALLSFHPDRTSGFDLRQQVEAEEKFKLISRMKDKIL